MYDAVLLTTHYNYTLDGAPIPPENSGEYEDLSMHVPLGMMYLAQHLHNSSFNVRVVHLPQIMRSLTGFGIPPEQKGTTIKTILKNYPARVCGIQVHFYLYCGGALFVSKVYKELFPDSKVFLGGYMAATYWREFLDGSDAVDGIIIGEGEKAFKKIVDRCRDPKDCQLAKIEGIAFRNNNNDVVYNPPSRESHLDLHEIPIILPDAPPFEHILWQKRNFLNISRGRCPEKCSYCVGNNKSINRRSYNTLGIDQIIEQIRVYQESGFQGIFLGENHFLDMPFMAELMERIITEDFSLHFELETHPAMFEDMRLLDRMIRANFLRYTMGCETGSSSLLRKMGRNAKPRQVIDSVRQIADRGAIVLTSWISNLPGETHAQFKETQDMLHEVVRTGGFVYWIENLHVFPGTALYQQPDHWGIDLLVKNLEDWVRWATLSKKYVTAQEAFSNPMDFLTHINRGVRPKEMIERFYTNRKLALSLVPKMKFNLKTRLTNLPSEIVQTEMQVLEWYENQGWKLWLF
jgi:radical SAM superfamily enzyme YgiQ (UPF0313 family)